MNPSLQPSLRSITEATGDAPVKPIRAATLEERGDFLEESRTRQAEGRYREREVETDSSPPPRGNLGGRTHEDLADLRVPPGGSPGGNPGGNPGGATVLVEGSSSMKALHRLPASLTEGEAREAIRKIQETKTGDARLEERDGRKVLLLRELLID